MLKVVRILFEGTVKRFAFNQSEDKHFRYKSVEDVIFPQGGVSCGNPVETMKLLHSTRRMG